MDMNIYSYSDEAKLFLGPAPEYFNPDKDFAIGPWCFIGQERKLDVWRDTPFLAPFKDEADRLRQANLCDQLHDWLLNEQAALFSERHPHLPKAYWQYLLSPWVLVAVCFSWSRYRVLERFFTENCQHRFIASSLKYCSNFSIYSLGQLPILVSSPFYNYWMVSSFVKEMNPSNVTLEEDATNLAPDWEQTPVSTHKQESCLKTWVNRAIDPIPGTRGWQRLLIAGVLWCRAKGRPHSVVPSLDSQWRPERHFPEAFLKVLRHTI